MEIPGCGEPGGRAEQKTRCCLGGQLGVDLGDEQDDRKGTRERSCAAAAPGGVPGWMEGWGHSLTWLCVLSGTLKHLASLLLHVFSSKSSQPVVCVEGTFYLVYVGLCCFISCSVLGDQGLLLSQTFIKCFWVTGAGWLGQGGVFSQFSACGCFLAFLCPFQAHAA